MFYLLALLVIIVFYYYLNNNLKYWTTKNVKYMKITPFFIGFFKSLFCFKTLTETTMEIYNLYPEEKMVGFFIGLNPSLMVMDPKLLKHISVLDFEHFSTRTKVVNEKDPMYTNLFHGDGDSWKLLKKALSPAFTIAKLKNMFPLMVKCADKLQILGDKIVERGGIVESHEMMSRYSVDFTSSCGMGLDFKVFDDNKWINFAVNLPRVSKPKLLALRIQSHFPFIKQFYTTHIFQENKYKVFIDMLKEVSKKRNYKPSTRHDFIDLLLEVAQLGKLKGNSIDKKNPDGSPAPAAPAQLELDLSEPVLFAAQVLSFFSAGFETSSSSTSYALHQLAMHPDIQRRVQYEIDEVLLKYDNKLCYEAVQKITLLEMVFLESMRMFPPGGVISRICTKKYTFPGTSTTIDPGVIIIVPVAAMHMDERFFENPHEFRPERFSPGYKERVGNVYYPFGLGKRMCIASNLGQMQSLTGLAAVLQRFTVEPAPTSTKHIKADRSIAYGHKADGGLPIKLVPRKLQ